MATLEIDVNCMCLVVTGADGAMHVLLPTTDEHGGHHQHVAVMLFNGPTGVQSVRLEGWGLNVDGTAPAPSARSAAAAQKFKETVPNLSAISGNGVDPKLFTSSSPAGVAMRINLGAARIVDVEAQARRWRLNGNTSRLANKIVLRAENVSPELGWEPIGATGGVPLGTLSNVVPEGTRNPVHRLSIHHVMKGHEPPQHNGASLNDDDVRHHFSAYYKLFGFTNVTNNELPFRFVSGGPGQPPKPAPPADVHYCKTAGGTTP